MVLFASCSKDGDNGPNLDGVPSGEIVAIEERDEALTGYSELKSTEESQKWWTHVISKFMFSSEECGDDVSYEEMGYYAFYPNGDLYVKTSLSGSATLGGTWNWTDESTKNEIYVYFPSLGQGQNFTITYLNESNVVYGSVQSASGCSVTTYEQFSYSE